jgi:hypothetical protein
MNQKALLVAMLLLPISSCTVAPKVILFNNAGEAITISFAGDSYRINSAKSRKIELYFVREFQVQMGATQYSYSVEYWSDDYAYFTGWWLFAARKMKAQFNADGKIFVLTQDQTPPISAVVGQPRGFPLVPGAT